MRTRNCVIILLIVALTGSAAMVMQAAQDNSSKREQTTQRKPPETRFASCIVRITIDPVIVPLDPATIQGLLYSSGVAGAAIRETLQHDSIDNPWEELIEMEWLNESSPRPSPTVGSVEETPSYDKEMLRNLEEVYGKEYMKQMGMIDSKTSDEQNQPAGGSVEGIGRNRTRVRGNPPAYMSPARSAPGGTSSATIKLSVHLPEDLPPVADEFLRAVISNLRSSLRHAYEVYISDLDDQLSQARQQYNYQIDLEASEGGTDAAARITEQLDKVVDLSVLTPEMPLSEAVEVLKRSVEPPLNIVVLWNDLMDSLSVEPSTPISINGMASIKLGTALDLLVRGIRSSGAKAMWRIKGDAIVIATAAGLGESGEPVGQLRAEVDTRALATQRNGLASKLQDLELSLAGQEARRRAIAEQIARTQDEAHARLAQDEVTKELENLVQLSAESLSNLRKQVDAGLVSTAELAQATESLTRARIELAKRREELSKQIGGGQLDQLNAEMSRMAIDGAEKEAQREILAKNLAQVQQQLAQASAFDPEAARMRVVREGLDIMARRIAELQTRMANLQPPMVTVIGAN